MLYRYVMIIMLAAVSITIAFSAIYSSKLSIQTQKNSDIQGILTAGRVIAASAAKSVVVEDENALEQAVAAFSNFPQFHQAHLYAINEQDNLSLVAIYVKFGEFLDPSVKRNLLSLTNGKLNDDLYETAIEIKYLERRVGYIYLKANVSPSTINVTNLIAIHVTVWLLVIGFCTLLTLRMKKVFVNPINQLTDEIQDIATASEFSARAKRTKIKELDSLVDAINYHLDRVETVINEQKETESNYKQLNVTLEQLVGERTEALKEANTELIQTLEKLHQFQHQLVENEKMASLGDMVAGVAHEVNTPIGLGVTASTMMLDKIAAIKHEFEGKTLKASTMANFLDYSEENLSIIYRNLSRAADLITSFKQVAVDQTSEESRLVNVKTLIEETLMSLQPKLRKTKHTISITCPEEVNVITRAGPINQIIINLIINSLTHAFENTDQGNIDIDAKLTDKKQLTIRFKDNGVGIPEKLKQRIFDPFVTTKRGQGGSGLGLHLVYNLVTQGLNGTITMVSEQGNGVEFTINFPVLTQE